MRLTALLALLLAVLLPAWAEAASTIPPLPRPRPSSRTEAPAAAPAPMPAPAPATRAHPVVPATPSSPATPATPPPTSPAAPAPTSETPPNDGSPAAANSPPGPTEADDISAPVPKTAAAAASAVAAKRQPVTLTATLTDGGATVNEGLVWRVFDSQADAKGQLTLAAKSNDAAPKLSLAPGDYVVHVAYGRAQATDTLTVTAGANTKSLILDAGALR
ncbi:MAG: hypothetical protein JWN11_2209, partial [Hyphomicrobiales bacterium]|nr:hypothetical protein [Hyphomicrobiales bacterium]